MRMIEDLEVTWPAALSARSQREASRPTARRPTTSPRSPRPGRRSARPSCRSCSSTTTRQQEITKELREVQAKLFETTERLGMLEDQSRRLDITAPVDGTVINLAYVTVGGVVAAGCHHPRHRAVGREDRGAGPGLAGRHRLRCIRASRSRIRFTTVVRQECAGARVARWSTFRPTA